MTDEEAREEEYLTTGSSSGAPGGRLRLVDGARVRFYLDGPDAFGQRRNMQASFQATRMARFTSPPTVVPGFLFLAFLWVAFAPAVRGQPEVLINEFLASNGATIADDDGDFEDWIELYNAGDQAIDLDGWGLSDDPDDPFRWTFPAVTLEPDDYLVVWASGKDRKPVDEEDPSVDPASPDTLPGLVSWFKADSISRRADGDSIAVWSDRSGEDNDAIAADSSREPTFRSDVINGLPALQFNGISHQFSLPRASFNGAENFENFTLLTLVRWDGGATSGIWGTGPSNENSGNIHFEIASTGGDLRLRVGNMNSITASNAVEPGSWSILGASQQTSEDDAVARLIRDGTVVGSGFEDPGTVDIANFGGLFLGNSHDSPRNFEGMIAEVILYDRSLTGEQRQGVENYLHEKYQLSDPPDSVPSLHTNFSLSKEGEPLLLTRSDGTRADEIAATFVPRNTSFGRHPDGADEWFFFLDPTPLESNATQTYSAPVDPPEFSHERGFYSDSFSLSLSHADGDAEIYYTTDGSPPSEANGTQYSQPIPIDTTATLRAIAVREGALPVPDIVTHTYLFVADVIEQPDDPAALGFPSAWGSWTAVHYGMHPEVTGNPEYGPRMTEALTSVPTLSLVIDMDDMFDSNTGLYANRTRKGFAWERPVSVELIFPDERPGFQIDAGLRSQGGASRNDFRTPKGSFRLLFKSIYDAPRLEYPFFLSSGSDLDDFNTITLRAEYNNEWLHPNGIGGGNQRARGQYVRDQFIRSLQIETTGYGSHSNHVHLYINGVYWGLYNPSERIDASFGANYFGGEREEWDAITHGGVRDGNRDAWDEMVAISNAGLSSLENYEALREFLDVPHYIDYMIVNQWAGTQDWPHNNWNAIRRREPGAGWKFFAWDSERSMENLNDSRTNVNADAAQFYSALRQNSEFRLLFADHVHRHLFNDGALTPERTIPHYSRLAAAVEAAVIAESARWGSYRRDKHRVDPPYELYTRNDQWEAEYNRLMNDYLPNRTAIVINQFRDANLYPQIDAPAFQPHGGFLNDGGTLTMSAPEGTIYFTTDGEDPREYGTGSVSSSATSYGEPLAFAEDTVVKARVLHNGEWSALNEADFVVPPIEPHRLADGPYTFDNWDPESPYRTYPDHMIFEQAGLSDPGLGAEMDGHWELPYNLDSRSRINGLGDGGISFINTANTQTVAGAGYLGSALLALDTTGEEGIRVQWTGGTVTPNARIYGIRLQYRVGGTGPFRDVPNETLEPVEYLRHETPGHAETFAPVRLPAEAENEPYVELRWKYYFLLGDSGPRAELRLDDILVTSADPSPADRLIFGVQPPKSHQSGHTLPALAVHAVDDQGLIDGTFNAAVSLGLNGDGEFTGPATVQAQAGVAFFENLALEGAGPITLTASSEGLDPVESESFRMLRLTERILPRYIQGDQDETNDNNDRVPFAFRLEIEGLEPEATYRYGNRVVVAADSRGQDGAGNAILVTGPDTPWIRNTDSPRFRAEDSGARHHTFTADESGAFTGWFVTEPTGNARFTPGNTVFMRLLINDGADGEEPFHFLTTESGITVLPFGNETNGGSGFLGETTTPARNFVLFYDNPDGQGRPLAAAPVEITGSGTDDRYAAFYHESVASRNGRWGTILPNDLTAGLQRLEVRSQTDGSLLNVRREPEGFAGTVDPENGLEPLTLAPLAYESTASYASWRDAVFPDPNDRNDPAVSGPGATPGNDGLPNLLRYAFAMSPDNAPYQKLPRLQGGEEGLTFSFGIRTEPADLAWLIERTEDLQHWNDIVFDSRNDSFETNEKGEAVIPFTPEDPVQFYRLRVLLLDN